MRHLRRGGGYYLDVGCSSLLTEGKIGLVRDEDTAILHAARR